MSGELKAGVLAAELESSPQALEHRLVATMRGLGSQIPQRPEIVRALAAAETIPAGLVIASEDQAAELVSTVRVLLDADKTVRDEVKRLLAIPKAMEAAVRAAVAETQAKFSAALAVGGLVRVAWQQEVRRRAAAAEKEAHRLAEAAAAEAAAKAEESGEDAPPVAQVAAPEIVRTVTGGAARSHTQVRVEPVVIVDYQAAQPFLMMDAKLARAAFLAAERRNETKRPEPGSRVRWSGIEFEAVESAVNR